MFRRRLFKIGIIAVPSLLALSAAAYAATTYTETRAFPPVTVASGETLKINLANVATASSSGTAASCSGSVAFYGTSTSVGAQSFTITSNAVQSITATGASGEVLLAVITLNQTSGTPCALQSSLEVLNTSSGVPRVVLPAPGPGGGRGGPGGFGGPGPGGR